MDRLASALLNPRRIALIGGSSDPKRLTARAQVYLRKHGFTGDLFPINPSAETILGERAYARLADVPGEIDLAYLLLGTQHVEGQIAAVAEKRIPVAAILADGFAEAGPEGRALQERLLATAKAAGVRLLGPNSMGLVNLNARTACSVNAALEAESLPAGRIALVSQSGSMMGAIMARGAPRGMGFSHLIGTGNEADLTASEIAGMLVEDPGVDAVLLFLEAIRAPEKLAAAARRGLFATEPEQRLEVRAERLEAVVLARVLPRLHRERLGLGELRDEPLRHEHFAATVAGDDVDEGALLHGE